MQAYIATI